MKRTRPAADLRRDASLSICYTGKKRGGGGPGDKRETEKQRVNASLDKKDK